MSRIYQQGDVVLIEAIAVGSKDDQFDGVIQHGEATGHAHRINMFRHDDVETVMLKADNKRYLRVGKDGIDITHEEHKTIHVPPGEYEVRIVREYDHFAEEARQVVD